MKTNIQTRTVSLSLLTVFITAFILTMITGVALAHTDAGVSVDASTQSNTNNSIETRTNIEADAGMTMCTMDAYQCPNGEWVGRTGSSCEFVCGGETVVQPNGSQSDSFIEPVEIDYDGSQSGSVSSTAVTPIGLMGIEISDSSTGGDRLSEVSISIDAVVVRGWDVGTKEWVRIRLEMDADSDRRDANTLSMTMAFDVMDNEPITYISMKNSVVTVSFKTELSVLGFIPVETKASVTASNNGVVSTKYPWWSFLARRSADDAIYADIASSIFARANIEG